MKYILDCFEAKYNELAAEEDGFEEDKDEYIAENIFFVPENARWSVIAAAAHTPEIGEVIDKAMRSIEMENKRLKESFPRTLSVRSWTSVVWRKWWTCLPISRWFKFICESYKHNLGDIGKHMLEILACFCQRERL